MTSGVCVYDCMICSGRWWDWWSGDAAFTIESSRHAGF